MTRDDPVNLPTRATYNASNIDPEILGRAKANITRLHYCTAAELTVLYLYAKSGKYGGLKHRCIREANRRGIRLIPKS